MTLWDHDQCDLHSQRVETEEQKPFDRGFLSKTKRWHISIFQCPIITSLKVSWLSPRKAHRATCQVVLRAVCHVARSKRKFGFWQTSIWRLWWAPMTWQRLTVKYYSLRCSWLYKLDLFLKMDLYNGFCYQITLAILWKTLMELLLPVTFKTTKKKSLTSLLYRTFMSNWIFIYCIWDPRQMANQN